MTLPVQPANPWPVQVTPDGGYGGGVTRAAGAAAPRPPDDTLVWVARRRQGIPAHRPDGALNTVCGRSMREGERLLAVEARAAYAAVWCDRCWPKVYAPWPEVA